MDVGSSSAAVVDGVVYDVYPNLPLGTDTYVSVTAYNTSGMESDYSNERVYVGGIAPTADAGADQMANVGETVILGSSPLTGVGYFWEQNSGATVALSTRTSSVTSFNAAAAGTYTFTLWAYGTDGTAASDSVTVSVLAPLPSATPSAAPIAPTPSPSPTRALTATPTNSSAPTPTRTPPPTLTRTSTSTATPTPTVTATAVADGVDLALGRPATQSSTAYGGGPVRAIDGNTDGDFSDGSVTHTRSTSHPWWQVDLQSIQSIDTIEVWNRTDCCSDRLSAFYVLVSNVPFTSNNLRAELRQSGVSSYFVAGTAGLPTRLSVNRNGRYVRVQLSGKNYLSLAEVRVFGSASGVPSPTPSATLPGPENGARSAEIDIAFGHPATQSSTAFGGNPARAVDGGTDGNFSDGSVTHTQSTPQPWWQVDLQSIHSIDTIEVWNRTDCCGDRLSAFYVLVSDVPFASNDLSAELWQSGVSSYFIAGTSGVPSRLSVNRTGRYVRVQLSGQNYLSLAEVRVLAPATALAPAIANTSTPTSTSTATSTPTPTPSLPRSVSLTGSGVASRPLVLVTGDEYRSQLWLAYPRRASGVDDSTAAQLALEAPGKIAAKLGDIDGGGGSDLLVLSGDAVSGSSLQRYRLGSDGSLQWRGEVSVPSPQVAGGQQIAAMGNLDPLNAGGEVVVVEEGDAESVTRAQVVGTTPSGGLEILSDDAFPGNLHVRVPLTWASGEILDGGTAMGLVAGGGPRGRIYEFALAGGRLRLRGVQRAFPESLHATARRLAVGNLVPEEPGDEIAVGDDGTFGDGLVRVFSSSARRPLLELRALEAGAAPDGVDVWVADVVPSIPGAELIVGQESAGGRLAVFSLATGTPVLLGEIPNPIGRTSSLPNHLAVGDFLPELAGNEVAVAQSDPQIPIQVFSLRTAWSAPQGSVTVAASAAAEISSIQ